MTESSHIDTILLAPQALSHLLFLYLLLRCRAPLNHSPSSHQKMHLLAVQIHPISSGDRHRESSPLLCLPPSCLAAQPSPAPGCVHCCVLTYPLLQGRSFTQGHPKHFPHPSVFPFLLLSSEPFTSFPLLVQLLEIKILTLLVSWM